MRVLMLGWEFPPAISGGLGTACHGLATALGACGVEITFVLPQLAPLPVDSGESGTTVDSEANSRADTRLPHVTFREVPVALRPYHPYVRVPAEVAEQVSPESDQESASIESLLAQVQRYSDHVLHLADWETFDVIHAHDWMTFPAAVALSRQSGRPLVVHIHSTEFDRGGAEACPQIFEIERDGLRAATRVIAVSDRTRAMLIDRFDVAPEKIVVVYNAVPPAEHPAEPLPARRHFAGRTILFAGRLAMQKGPEYFLAAARKVADEESDVRFVMAGDGERMESLKRIAADLGIADRVEFPGFLQGDDLAAAFSSADLFVMPSVSEPFGIVPLEALSHGVPAIISRQSGVAEVLQDVLTVDFWDVDDLADKMLAVLRHEPLRAMLADRGRRNADRTSWESSARQCRRVYDHVVAL